MENPGCYTRAIYRHEAEVLYVNLLIASTYISEDLSLTIETDFRTSEQVKICLNQTVTTEKTIKIRVPSWVKSPVRHIYNNETFEQLEAGDINVIALFHEGYKILVTLPMCLYEYVSMDDTNKIAVMYGPIVLAAQLVRESFPKEDIVSNHLSLMTHSIIRVPKLIAESTSIEEWASLVDRETLTFKTTAIAQPGDVSFILKPFYATHHERYSLYLFKYTPQEYKQMNDEVLT